MKINAARTADGVRFDLAPNDEDVAYCENRKGKLSGRSVTLKCGTLHPDIQALLGLLIAAPFTAKSFELDRGVSPAFAEAVAANLKRKIGPIDDAVTPRQPGGRDALAFSGGVDSVAALAVMPKETVAVFLHRVSDVETKSMYRADAALRSCEAVRATGREVIVADTDLEHVRTPVGFPIDWSNAAPAVALADELGLRSVSFGMIAESAFHLGHHHYSDLASRAIYRSWAPVFDAVGVSISLPTAGVSEVVTSRIAAAYPEMLAQSCVRGTGDTPCGRCFKCFRKTLLDAAVTGRKVAPSHFDNLNPEVVRRLGERPIHHEAVLAYSIHRMPPVDHPLYRALFDLTRPLADAYGLDYLDRLYTRGLDYVHASHRDEVARNLSRFAAPMSLSEAQGLSDWSLDGILAEAPYQTAGQKVQALLEA